MKRAVLIAILLASLFSSGLFAIPMKFDLSLSGNIGKYFGLANAKVNDLNLGTGSISGPINMSLQGFPFGGGVTFDFIFLTENKPYYGMALSVYAGFEVVQQSLGSSIMTNGQTDGFIGASNSTLIQTLSTMQFEIAPMFRFYPTRDFSIGIGPVINFMINKGNNSFLQSEAYTNANGLNKYYIKPMFGSVYISAMIDAQVTKFFGNFGIFGGVNIKLLFIPFSVGLGGQIGIRYRFEP